METFYICLFICRAGKLDPFKNSVFFKNRFLDISSKIFSFFCFVLFCFVNSGSIKQILLKIKYQELLDFYFISAIIPFNKTSDNFIYKERAQTSDLALN